MFRSLAARFGSAHAIAFLALLMTLGGGYAVAQNGAEPEPTVAYFTSLPRDFEPEGGRSSLISQLEIPADGQFLATATLNVRKGQAKRFSRGKVTCQIGSVGRGDTATLTLDKGDSGNLSLSAVGRPAKSSVSTQAMDLYCTSSKSQYVVSGAEMTVVALDGVNPPLPE